MAENGKLLAIELAPIPGGELRNDAAAAWNAGPAKAGLRPTGSRSSYRTYAEQVEFWNIYLAGGNLAARPGTSNHGWGIAVDVAEEWMRSWIDDHGARFGWRKTEAFSEWWHVNFVGGVNFPEFVPLEWGKKNSRKRVRFYTKRLAFIHPLRDPKDPRSGAYLKRPVGRPGSSYRKDVVAAVKDFQRDHGLSVDGIIGEDTAHKISEIFHKQYIARKGKRKRKLKDKLLRRP